MKILVLNCGSSSIKYKLFEMDTCEVLTQGGVEKIGLPDSFLQIKCSNGEKVIIEKSMPEHTVGIQLILDSLVDEKVGCIKSLEEIQAMEAERQKSLRETKHESHQESRAQELAASLFEGNLGKSQEQEMKEDPKKKKRVGVRR